jgi:hypothetical protein
MILRLRILHLEKRKQRAILFLQQHAGDRMLFLPAQLALGLFLDSI